MSESFKRRPKSGPNATTISDINGITQETRTTNSPPPLPRKSRLSRLPTDARDRRRPDSPTSSYNRQTSLTYLVLGLVLVGIAALVVFLFLPHRKTNDTTATGSKPISELPAEYRTPVRSSGNESSSEPVATERRSDVEDQNATSGASLQRKTNLPDTHVIPSVSAPDSDSESAETSIETQEVETESEPNPKADEKWIPKENEADPSSDSEEASVDDVDKLVEMAIVQMKADQRQGAMTLLKRASNIAPKEPRVDFYLGFLCLGVAAQEPKDAKAKTESAELHFNKAFNRTTDGTLERVAAANNLALVELKLRKFAAARNYFSIAAKYDPRPIEVDHNLSRLLTKTNVFDIKPAEVKKLNALKPDKDELQPYTGWIYLPLDKSEKTLDECLTFYSWSNLEDLSCIVCNGCAQLICKQCVGRGKVGVLGSTSEKRDIGFGVTVTLSAPATSLVGCSACGGAGRVDCDACINGRDPKLRR